MTDEQLLALMAAIIYGTVQDATLFGAVSAARDVVEEIKRTEPQKPLDKRIPD